MLNPLNPLGPHHMYGSHLDMYDNPGLLDHNIRNMYGSHNTLYNDHLLGASHPIYHHFDSHSMYDQMPLEHPDCIAAAGHRVEHRHYPDYSFGLGI